MTGLKVMQEGEVADCCADLAQRVTLPGDPARPWAVHQRCGACGRNHYRMIARLAPRRGPGAPGPAVD